MPRLKLTVFEKLRACLPWSDCTPLLKIHEKGCHSSLVDSTEANPDCSTVWIECLSTVSFAKARQSQLRIVPWFIIFTSKYMGKCKYIFYTWPDGSVLNFKLCYRSVASRGGAYKFWFPPILVGMRDSSVWRGGADRRVWKGPDSGGPRRKLPVMPRSPLQSGLYVLDHNVARNMC